MMSIKPNTMLYPLIQTGKVTLEQEEQEYRAEKGKERESMSSEQDTRKILESYNVDLKADFDRLQRQNVFMQAEFDQKLNEMCINFKVRIKNKIHELQKKQLRETTDKKYRDW